MRPGCASVLVIAVIVSILISAWGWGAEPGPGTWTDPGQAAAEDPDFVLQGEYIGDGAGLQVAALGGGQFYLSRFPGGLPGAGWNQSAPEVRTGEAATVKEATAGMERVERKSPTLGKAAPEGADVLVGAGVEASLVAGDGSGGVLWAGAKSVKEYGDFTMHVEFRLPYKPAAALSSQDRGNSGLYLQDRYEVQVLDSFGLVFEREYVMVPIKSDPQQWCGCLYKFKTADVPMCLPPLAWQTYDIRFTAPRFDPAGNKTSNATLTVDHNGVRIHDAVSLPKGTGIGGSRKEVAKGPIIFQGHGNPVAFRNVWIAE